MKIIIISSPYVDIIICSSYFISKIRGCLQFMIVVFPDHTHLLFLLAALSSQAFVSE